MQIDDLTPEEIAVRGETGDLVDEDLVPARPRSTSVMFSLRIDRQTFEALSAIAEQRGLRFSDVARNALRSYVDRAGEAGKSRDLLEAIAEKLGVVSTPRKIAEVPAPYISTRDASVGWTSDELFEALARYEELGRTHGMTEHAVHSYWDYARQFLAWRNGGYRPRGASGPGPAQRRGRATIADLEADANEYAQDVEAAGLAQPTIDTYYRHAMFFVRWLGGSFIPGGRLRGL